jgi:hypothetical protein
MLDKVAHLREQLLSTDVTEFRNVIVDKYMHP